MNLFLMLVFVMIGLSACGRNRPDEYDEITNEQQHITSGYNAEANNNAAAAEMPYRTLVVLANHRHVYVLQQAADSLNSAWAAQQRNYTFNLELEVYDFWDFESSAGRLMRLQTELMAGSGPDMFIWNGHPIHAYARSGLLKNIYTLIDNCPETNREDFFVQALRAFEANDGLYMFPMNFGFEFVGINASLPQTVIDKFMEHRTISVNDLIEIYFYFRNVYGHEFPHLNFTQSGYMLSLQGAVMGGFICYNSRTSNLDDDMFVSFLYNLRELSPQFELVRYRTSGLGRASIMHELAEDYVFIVENQGLGEAFALLTPYEPYFLHYIPLTNMQGQLFTNHSIFAGGVSVCITAAGDSALAWEFTRHLITAYSVPEGRAVNFPDSSGHAWGAFSLSSPIMRSLFPQHIERAFGTVFTVFFGGEEEQPQAFRNTASPQERSQEIENAKNRIAAYNEMPITLMVPTLPWDLISEPTDQLQLGLITPQTAAQRMHNAVSLWLIE